MSDRLAQRLSAHRTAALQIEVARHPQVALAALVHGMVQTVLQGGYHGHDLPLGVSLKVQDRLEGIAPDATLKQAMALMTYSRHRHLMVTEDAKLVGILSLGDIVKNLLSELELEKAVLQDIYMAAH